MSYPNSDKCMCAVPRVWEDTCPGLEDARVAERPRVGRNDINCERGHHAGSDCRRLGPSVLVRLAKEPDGADGPLKSKMDSAHTQPAGCCLGCQECVSAMFQECVTCSDLFCFQPST